MTLQCSPNLNADWCFCLHSQVGSNWNNEEMWERHPFPNWQWHLWWMSLLKSCYWKNRGLFVLLLFTMQWLQTWHFLSFIYIINIFSVTFLNLDQGSANYNSRATLNLLCLTPLNDPFLSKYYSALMCTMYMNMLFNNQLYIISSFLDLLFAFHFFHIPVNYHYA